MSQIANRYATALFGAAERQGATEQVGKDLAALQAQLAAPALARTVLAADVPDRVRRGSLVPAMAGFHELTVSAISVVLERRRIEVLPLLANAFEALRQVARGELHGVIETARPLQPDQLSAVEEAASRAFGKKVKLTVKDEPALLGGLRIRIGNTLWDGSVKAQLEELQKQLIEASIS